MPRAWGMSSLEDGHILPLYPGPPGMGAMEDTHRGVRQGELLQSSAAGEALQAGMRLPTTTKSSQSPPRPGLKPPGRWWAASPGLSGLSALTLLHCEHPSASGSLAGKSRLMLCHLQAWLWKQFSHVCPPPGRNHGRPQEWKTPCAVEAPSTSITATDRH